MIIASILDIDYDVNDMISGLSSNIDYGVYDMISDSSMNIKYDIAHDINDIDVYDICYMSSVFAGNGI